MSLTCIPQLNKLPPISLQTTIFIYLEPRHAVCWVWASGGFHSDCWWRWQRDKIAWWPPPPAAEWCGPPEWPLCWSAGSGSSDDVPPCPHSACPPKMKRNQTLISFIKTQKQGTKNPFSNQTIQNRKHIWNRFLLLGKQTHLEQIPSVRQTDRLITVSTKEKSL